MLPGGERPVLWLLPPGPLRGKQKTHGPLRGKLKTPGPLRGIGEVVEMFPKTSLLIFVGVFTHQSSCSPCSCGVPLAVVYISVFCYLHF